MKKRLSTILAVMFMAVILIPFTPVQAASTDVTGKMAGNREIKNISKMMTAYTTAMNLSEQSTTRPVKMKLNDNAKLSIAVFVRYNYKGDYSYTAKELRSETKKLFGKSASVNNIRNKKNKNHAMLVCSSNSKYYKDPYMYCGGDFGDVIPDYKITKVTRYLHRNNTESFRMLRREGQNEHRYNNTEAEEDSSRICCKRSSLSV